MEKTQQEQDHVNEYDDTAIEEEEGDAQRIEKLAFKVPRKFMPFVNETDELVVKKKKDPLVFQDNLRGPIGYQAIFMPNPGFVPFLPPQNTPPASTPPSHHVQASSQQSTTTRATSSTTRAKPSKLRPVRKQRAPANSVEVPVEAPVQSQDNVPVQAPLQASRRSTRLLEKRAFLWTNTPDDPVELGD